MRTILFLVQKEFLQVFRNKTMLPLLLVMPVVQLCCFLMQPIMK